MQNSFFDPNSTGELKVSIPPSKLFGYDNSRKSEQSWSVRRLKQTVICHLVLLILKEGQAKDLSDDRSCKKILIQIVTGNIQESSFFAFEYSLDKYTIRYAWPLSLVQFSSWGMY